MTAKSETLSISNSKSPYKWINIEQEYQRSEADYVSPNDIYQMLSRAMAGKSATTYIDDSCSYIRIVDGEILIDLAIYIWPENLDMEYSLSPTIGDVSAGEYFESFKSQDVIFNGESRQELGFIFDGEYYYQMPVISTSGAIIHDIEEPAKGEWYFQYDMDVHTVIRINGIAKGYRHIVTMKFNKSDFSPAISYTTTGWIVAGLNFNKVKYPPVFNGGAIAGVVRVEFRSHLLGDVKFNGRHIGHFRPTADFVSEYFTISKNSVSSIVDGGYFEFEIIEDSNGVTNNENKISDINNEITVTWKEGSEEFSKIISLNIPPCVDTLLTMCQNDYRDPSWYLTINNGEDDEFLNVYYSTCSGKPIAEHWEKR